MLLFAALGVGTSNRSLVVVPARDSYSSMLHPVRVEHSRSEIGIGAFVSYQTSLMQLLTVWHTRSAKSVGAFNSYVVPVPTVSGTHTRSLVDVGVRVLSLVGFATSHGQLRKSPWLSTVLDGARVWYWSPERTVPQAHTRSEVAADEDTSYPPSSHTGFVS